MEDEGGGHHPRLVHRQQRASTDGDKDDLLAFFSSKGLQTGNGAAYFKPDVSAYSPGPRTSPPTHSTPPRWPACPWRPPMDVADVVAIVKSVNPAATHDQMVQYLMVSTDRASLNTTEPRGMDLRHRHVPGAPNRGGVWPNYGGVNVGTILRCTMTAAPPAK
ncbi:hypothetical protein H257_11290 [Aphanomyces astaci]|uniref:Uncharacterized protein n=1 Tax=Aphanomyces astaci TaxID=112090 RepID=W4G2R0_APHAT|nr:hypothetical protein H257_11290 [Aphanomyces astaci]ETV73975.1 hypothetical protein H257_11290 [Aphanomyces astaci]|eukprot:XP_009836488.1 hypothetical protein H257_11290 [Aphanomyces astaci]